MLGVFRDGHPRTTLALGGNSRPLSVEFTVDTGFAGDLALPGHLARQLGIQPSAFRDWMLAGGIVIKCPIIEVIARWEDQTRRAEALILAGHPLIGTQFLDGFLLQ